MKDPEFVSDVKNSKFELDPEDGDHLQALIAKIYATPRAIVDKLNATANKLFQSKDFEEKFARVGDERLDIALPRGAGDGLQAPTSVVKDRDATGAQEDIGDLPQGNAHAGNARQHQGTHLLRVAPAGRVQHHGQVDRLALAVNLGDDFTLVGGLHGFQHLHRAETQLGQAF